MPMDAEDLGRDIDKLEETLRGKQMEIDEEKVSKEIEELMRRGREGSDERQEAIEKLLGIEKQGRNAEDPVSTKKACCGVLELLYEAKEYKELQEKVVLMTKRRGQLKEVVKAMVRQCMEYVEEENTKLERKVREDIIKTLQSITEGKIYVEIERARITRQLAQMKEEDGDVEEAATILQEVAVVRLVICG